MWKYRSEAPLYDVTVAKDKDGKTMVLAGGVDKTINIFFADKGILI